MISSHFTEFDEFRLHVNAEFSKVRAEIKALTKDEPKSYGSLRQQAKVVEEEPTDLLKLDLILPNKFNSRQPSPLNQTLAVTKQPSNLNKIENSSEANVEAKAVTLSPISSPPVITRIITRPRLATNPEVEGAFQST